MKNYIMMVTLIIMFGSSAGAQQLDPLVRIPAVNEEVEIYSPPVFPERIVECICIDNESGEICMDWEMGIYSEKNAAACCANHGKGTSCTIYYSHSPALEGGSQTEFPCD